MARHALDIRDARPEDAPALLELWATDGRSTDLPSTRSAEEAATALANIAASSDERILVGIHDGELVAAVHLHRATLSPFHDEMVVHTSYLLVRPDQRKHGFARALLDAAVTWAEEKDCSRITAITASGSRDTNRFLARLGLGTVATIRVAHTSALRRRLTPEAIRPHDARRNLGRVLAQRRTIQRRREAGDAV
jgi:GNAT superfamily N-acetyltransferase